MTQLKFVFLPVSFSSLRIPLLSLATLLALSPGLFAQPIDVADRWELFVDDHVVESLSGGASRVLQIPEPKDVVFTADAAWEGNSTGYFTLFQDGPIYRMYYRGSRKVTAAATTAGQEESETTPAAQPEDASLQVTCLAESKDGLQWTRPNFGLFDWEGSKDNNIILKNDTATHNFVPFKDSAPDVPAEALYKAVGREGPLRVYHSPDGIHWKKVSDKPIVKEGTFDSQNVPFWDAAQQQYRLYWRMKVPATPPGKGVIRGIRTASSKDFLNWENQADLVYTVQPQNAPPEKDMHLYTNTVQPYFRAPQILIGFPTQFTPKGAKTQPLFISSRDGVNFNRWDQPVIPPTAPMDRGEGRGNYMQLGMLQLPGEPNEISVYASEAGGELGPKRLRRFVYRLDGFVSINAGPDGGEFVTKPLRFSGKSLKVNYKAKEGGVLRAELQDESGKPIAGFGLDDCEPLTRDSVDATVNWKGQNELPAQPLRVRFELKNADIFSMKL